MPDSALDATARVVSTALQPAVSLAVCLGASGIQSGAGIRGIAAATGAVVVAPYAAGKLSARLVPSHWPDKAHSILRAAAVSVTACTGAALLRTTLPTGLSAACTAIADGSMILTTTRVVDEASAHTATFTTTSLLLGGTVHPAWRSTLALLPLLAWSRVRLGEHSPFQTLLGAAAGAAASGLAAKK